MQKQAFTFKSCPHKFFLENKIGEKSKCLGMNRCTTSKTCKLNLDSNKDLCDDIIVCSTYGAIQ